MKPAARIYGEFSPIPAEARGRVQEALPLFESVQWDGPTLRVEHESYALDPNDIEEFVRTLAAMGLDGHLDHIDNDAWVLHRYVLRHGEISSRHVGLNEVLEGLRTS